MFVTFNERGIGRSTFRLIVNCTCQRWSMSYPNISMVKHVLSQYLNGEACPMPLLGIRAGVVFIGGN